MINGRKKYFKSTFINFPNGRLTVRYSTIDDTFRLKKIVSQNFCFMNYHQLSGGNNLLQISENSVEMFHKKIYSSQPIIRIILYTPDLWALGGTSLIRVTGRYSTYLGFMVAGMAQGNNF